MARGVIGSLDEQQVLEVEGETEFDHARAIISLLDGNTKPPSQWRAHYTLIINGVIWYRSIQYTGRECVARALDVADGEVRKTLGRMAEFRRKRKG